MWAHYSPPTPPTPCMRDKSHQTQSITTAFFNGNVGSFTSPSNNMIKKDEGDNEKGLMPDCHRQDLKSQPA